MLSGYEVIFWIVTGVVILISTLLVLFKEKNKDSKNESKVVGFMGSSSYWFKTLKINNKVISVKDAVSMTKSWINENLREENSVSFTDFVNAFYCLKIFEYVESLGYDNVYSNRGTDAVKTTLLGQIERSIGPHAADAGSGEIKCSNGESISTESENVAEFLKKNGIRLLYATGSWRDKSYSEILEFESKWYVSIMVISQEQEKEMEKESFVSAMKILEPKIEVVAIHAHGNGSSQGDIIENNFGLKKIKKFVTEEIENDYLENSWDKVEIKGEGSKQTIEFKKTFDKERIIQDMEIYIIQNMI